MGTFRYSAVDRAGRNCSGLLVASNERELESMLRGRGIWLLKSEEDRTPSVRNSWKPPRLGRRQLVQFCTLMEFQCRVGIPMVQALDAIAQDGESRRINELVVKLRQGVERGEALSEAMAGWPGVFPAELVHLIRAGERGGSLPEAFRQAKTHLEWQERIAADVKQATTYPCLVLLATGVFVGVLFTVVVPKFVTLLSAVKVPLPAPTRIVFGIATFARDTGGWILLAVVGLWVTAVWARHRSMRVARILDRVRIRLPVLGPLLLMASMTRLAHNLGLLYRNGVSLPTALELVEGMVGSIEVKEAVEEVRRRVLNGETLSESMRRREVFPGLLVRLVVVGERTGQLDEALVQVAAHYQELLPRRMKRLLGLLEPTLILGLVAVVGLVAMSVILPVLSLMQGLR